MSARKIIVFLLLLVAAASSWYLVDSLSESEVIETQGNAVSDGYYLKSARILSTGNDGRLLYNIKADYVEQLNGADMFFQNVQIRYSPTAQVPWIFNADTATISDDQQRIILKGNVLAVNARGFDRKNTEIRTQYLEFEPDIYRAHTQAQVQIRIGPRSIIATGMLALLQENRLELKSNVNGKFVP
jgi:LPS export ABC transporter protein LptC